MFNFFSLKQKIFIIISLVILVLVPFIFFSIPQKTEAYDLTYDPINWIQNTLTAVSTGDSYISEYALEIKEYIGDGLAYAVAQAIIHQMVADTVSWINSGFDGNPAYLTNFDSFLTNTEDRVMSSYINNPNSPLRFVCNSFRSDVKKVLVQNFAQNNTYKPSCTVESVGKNAKSLIDGLDNKWDWNTWDKLTLSQNNNAYGSYFIASRDLNSRINSKISQEKTQLNWGQGFKPFQQCDDVEYNNPDYGIDGDNRKVIKEKHCENVTPGTVISHSLNKSLGAGQDALIQADEIDELVGALLGQLVESVFNKGLKNYDKSSLLKEGTDLSGPSGKIKKEIEKSIKGENDYIPVKKESISSVDEILTFLNKLLTTCNNESGKEWLKSKISEYQSIKSNLQGDIDLAEANLEKLNELNTKLQEEKDPSAENLQDIWKEYEKIRSELHNGRDLVMAKSERDGLKDKSISLELEANKKCA